MLIVLMIFVLLALLTFVSIVTGWFLHRDVMRSLVRQINEQPSGSPQSTAAIDLFVKLS